MPNFLTLTFKTNFCPVIPPSEPKAQLLCSPMILKVSHGIIIKNSAGVKTLSSPLFFPAWMLFDNALTNRKDQQKYTSVSKGKAFLQEQEEFQSTCCIVGV